MQKWQVRSKEEKEKVARRKEKIVKNFRNEMGLTVDKTKPGSGNTNDGNTARQFFRNHSISAKITGINETIIIRFGSLLQALSTGYNINIQAFDEYAKEIAILYLQHYPWYFMPATVHKILIHGSKIIEAAILPIGQLSEEAQEARNKDCRRYRERNTLKSSRQLTMQDLLNMLLLSSDPVISLLKHPYTLKNVGTLTSEVRKLLEEPAVSSQSVFDINDDDDSSSTGSFSD